MDPGTIYELIGYVASVLVAVSLMMRSILKLRVINLVGAVTFVVYGLLIEAYPVALVNFIIVLINLYYLYGISRTRERFTVLEVPPDAPYLRHVLRVHRGEIERVAPGFALPRADAAAVTTLLLRDEVPTGVFVAEREDEAEWRVGLDFVLLDERGRTTDQGAGPLPVRRASRGFSRARHPAARRRPRYRGACRLPAPDGLRAQLRRPLPTDADAVNLPAAVRVNVRSCSASAEGDASGHPFLRRVPF